MSKRWIAAGAALLLVLAGACAPGRALEEGARPDDVPLRVENQNFYPATIFLVANGHRVRAGEVSGNSTETLTARMTPRARMSVEVRLLAVGTFTSFSVDVMPGDTIHVLVPPDLHRRAPGG